MANELSTIQSVEQPRSLPVSAGHLTVAVSAELGRLLVANRGDCRKALAAGLTELAKRKSIHAQEATELAAIMELFFDAPDGQDPNLVKRASTYFHALIMDQQSSPAALAIASVITAQTSPTNAPGVGGPRTASAKGTAVFAGVGAVIGAGIGAGFGGPIGAGFGAVVGAAVGACIANS